MSWRRQREAVAEALGNGPTGRASVLGPAEVEVVRRPQTALVEPVVLGKIVLAAHLGAHLRLDRSLLLADREDQAELS